jgi:hypothetical protein
MAPKDKPQDITISLFLPPYPKDTRKSSPKKVPGKGKVSTEQIHTGRSSVILVVARKNHSFYICPDGELRRRRERVSE